MFGFIMNTRHKETMANVGVDHLPEVETEQAQIKKVLSKGMQF